MARQFRIHLTLAAGCAAACVFSAVAQQGDPVLAGPKVDATSSPKVVERNLDGTMRPPISQTAPAWMSEWAVRQTTQACGPTSPPFQALAPFLGRRLLMARNVPWSGKSASEWTMAKAKNRARTRAGSAKFSMPRNSCKRIDPFGPGGASPAAPGR